MSTTGVSLNGNPQTSTSTAEQAMMNTTLSDDLPDSVLIWLMNEELSTKNMPCVWFMAVVAIIALLGNSTVIFIYSTKIKKNTANFFILVLAVFDILAGTFLFFEVLDRRYPMYSGKSIVLCKLVRILEATFNLNSLGLLVCIGFDRFFKICKPLKSFSIRRSKILLVAVMCLSSLFMIPMALFHGPKKTHVGNNGAYGTDCGDDEHFDHTILKSSYYGFLMLMYLVFFGIMIGLYTKLYLAIRKWKKTFIGEDIDAIRHKMSISRNSNQDSNTCNSKDAESISSCKSLDNNSITGDMYELKKYDTMTSSNTQVTELDHDHPNALYEQVYSIPTVEDKKIPKNEEISQGLCTDSQTSNRPCQDLLLMTRLDEVVTMTECIIQELIQSKKVLKEEYQNKALKTGNQDLFKTTINVARNELVIKDKSQCGQEGGMESLCNKTKGVNSENTQCFENNDMYHNKRDFPNLLADLSNERQYSESLSRKSSSVSSSNTYTEFGSSDSGQNTLQTQKNVKQLCNKISVSSVTFGINNSDANNDETQPTSPTIEPKKRRRSSVKASASLMQTTFIFVVITAMLIISYIPYFTIEVLNAIGVVTIEHIHLLPLWKQQIYIVFNSSFCINNAINPIIYSVLNPRFRSEVKAIFTGKRLTRNNTRSH